MKIKYFIEKWNWVDIIGMFAFLYVVTFFFLWGIFDLFGLMSFQSILTGLTLEKVREFTLYFLLAFTPCPTVVLFF